MKKRKRRFQPIKRGFHSDWFPCETGVLPHKFSAKPFSPKFNMKALFLISIATLLISGAHAADELKLPEGTTKLDSMSVEDVKKYAKLITVEIVEASKGVTEDEKKKMMEGKKEEQKHWCFGFDKSNTKGLDEKVTKAIHAKCLGIEERGNASMIKAGVLSAAVAVAASLFM